MITVVATIRFSHPTALPLLRFKNQGSNSHSKMLLREVTATAYSGLMECDWRTYTWLYTEFFIKAFKEITPSRGSVPFCLLQNRYQMMNLGKGRNTVI